MDNVYKPILQAFVGEAFRSDIDDRHLYTSDRLDGIDVQAAHDGCLLDPNQLLAAKVAEQSSSTDCTNGYSDGQACMCRQQSMAGTGHGEPS